MNIKAGDKVRFLNSVGGGIVRSFKGKDQVIVEGDDGFEIPALIRELVVVEHLDSQTRSLKPEQQAPVITAPEPQPKPKEEPIPEETPGGERLNVFLAYLPLEPKAIQQSRYECFFINESNYYLLFNYMNRNNNSWESRYNGLIEPNTKIFIEEFGKEDINSLERICIQCIAFKKDKPYALKNAISVELRIDTVKFYKRHCFMENDFFEEDALIYPVVKGDIPERELLVSSAELQEAILQKVRIDKSLPRPEAKKKAPSPVLEVDLHINQLLDNTNGMSGADLLSYQMNKFHETLAQYARHKGQKIVFIHGKGDGVLRNSIEKELKTKYKEYYYQDASFREYGFGATMVTIK
ncbi:MAG: DUF2027 domain-containing protein [Tannerellaceae bacterium]|jgi:hypothetical protein|nr:DUF2027 domain-containing protein [Tannerellaceae bacterium]